MPRARLQADWSAGQLDEFVDQCLTQRPELGVAQCLQTQKRAVTADVLGL